MKFAQHKKQSGQATIEMVLMLVVTVGIAMAVSKGFRDNEMFANLVSGPWKNLAGLIQNGVWGTPKDTMTKHPNQFSRVNTVKGEELQ